MPPIPPHHKWNEHHDHPPFGSWAGIWGGIRYGQFGYGPGDFGGGYCYGGYESDDDDGDCTPSAWYYYPNLPPYIQDSQIQPDGATSSGPASPRAAVYPPDWKPDLDHALADLKNAWERNDQKALARLLPTDGSVTVTVEGQESYKLTAKEFADLFGDGIYNTKTLAYGVVQAVQVAPDEVEVTARHEFKDPWGQLRTIEHVYTLVQGDKGYVIRAFTSSSYK